MKLIYTTAILLTYLCCFPGASAANIENGEKVVNLNCLTCHKAGILGAPKIGSAEDWAKRTPKGIETIETNAIKGFNNMPAKGGNFQLSDQDIKDAVAYMINSASDKKDIAKEEVVNKPNPVSKKDSTTKVTEKVKTPKKPKISKSMQFNRLMKPPSEWNPPPFEDGIHDPDGEGAYALQAPKEAFAELEKSSSGNRVDWVKSLENGLITPRYDAVDETKEPLVMDLNIVREVKGSMPNVVYPHKQHTEWLDCANCHPDIFVPKKGANSISMASILMGEQCGVCHGKVAFPVSECRKCHSQNKKKSLIAGQSK